MKKTGQALFLTLLILAGARCSDARGAAGSAPETHKRANLNQESSNKTDPQSKKQPGYFNRCTRYAHNMFTSMQKDYNALDPMYQNMIKFSAAGALTVLLWMYGTSGESKGGKMVGGVGDISSSKILVEVEVNDQADVNGGGNQMDGGESKGLGNVPPYSNYRPICNAIVDYFLSDSTGEFRDQNQRKMDVIDGLSNSEAYIGGENPGGQFNKFEPLTDLLNDNIRKVELSQQSSRIPTYCAGGVFALIAIWYWKYSWDVAAAKDYKSKEIARVATVKLQIDQVNEEDRKQKQRLDACRKLDAATVNLLSNQKKFQGLQAWKEWNTEALKLLAEKSAAADKQKQADLEQKEKQEKARIEEAAMIVKESVTSIVQGAIEKAQEDEEAKIAAERTAQEKANNDRIKQEEKEKEKANNDRIQQAQKEKDAKKKKKLYDKKHQPRYEYKYPYLKTDRLKKEEDERQEKERKKEEARQEKERKKEEARQEKERKKEEAVVKIQSVLRGHRARLQLKLLWDKVAADQKLKAEQEEVERQKAQEEVERQEAQEEVERQEAQEEVERQEAQEEVERQEAQEQERELKDAQEAEVLKQQMEAQLSQMKKLGSKDEEKSKNEAVHSHNAEIFSDINDIGKELNNEDGFSGILDIFNTSDIEKESKNEDGFSGILDNNDMENKQNITEFSADDKNDHQMLESGSGSGQVAIKNNTKDAKKRSKSISILPSKYIQ